MAVDISLTPLAIDLPDTVVSDVNALEKRGTTFVNSSTAGLAVVAVAAVGTSIWWWLGAPELSSDFHSIDLPASIASLKGTVAGAAGAVPFESMLTTVTSWMNGGIGKVVSLAAVAYGLGAGLFKQNIGAAIVGVGGGMLLASSPTFVGNMFGDAPSTTTPPALVRYIDNKDWPGALTLLSSDPSEASVYVRAQIAYLNHNTDALKAALSTLESMGLGPGAEIKLDHLDAMERAAYGHSVTDYTGKWEADHLSARISAEVAINRLFSLEGSASVGLFGAFGIGLWLKRRAARLKAMISPFSSAFSPKPRPVDQSTKQAQPVPAAPNAEAGSTVIEVDKDDPATDLLLSYELGIPTNLSAAAVIGAELSHQNQVERRVIETSTGPAFDPGVEDDDEGGDPDFDAEGDDGDLDGDFGGDDF